MSRHDREVLGAALAVLEPPEDARRPPAALAARRALPAGFVGVEADHPRAQSTTQSVSSITMIAAVPSIEPAAASDS